MTIETSTLKTEINTMEELKQNTERTPISDIWAKKAGVKPSTCAIWNGNIFHYVSDNEVVVYDYFSRKATKYVF